MLDYQRIVDDLRSAVAAAGPESVDMLRICAADYTLACNETNDRLRQCGALLKQGLRSEAIQLGDLEPNLLDVTAVLDFPERGAIGQVLRRAGIMPPPQLLVDIASELNEAYAQHEPLESMLAQHRLLAIARAPLAMRLKTLRRLAELDPNTPVWREDLAAFESERLKEIQKEGDKAARQKDLPVLDALLDELRRAPWRDPVAGSLVKALSKAADSLQDAHSRKVLERLADELNAAFSELDFAKGRNVRDQWEVYSGSCKLSPTDALLDQVAPALAWLYEEDQREEKQQQFKTAVAAIEQALDRNYRGRTDERNSLSRIFHAAQRHGMEIPQHLVTRYHARIQALDLTASRKSRLIFAGIVGASLAVMGVIGAILWQQIRSAEVAEHVATLSKMVEDGRLAEADQYIQRLAKTKPHVAENATVQELATQVAKKIDDENQRRRLLTEALEKVQKTGFDLPDSQSLDQARKLVKTSEEKSQIAEIDSQIAAAKRMTQRQRDDNYLAKLNGLADQVRQFEERRDVAPSDALALLKLVEKELSVLEATAGLVSVPVRAQAAPVGTRLRTLQAAVERQQREAASLSAIDSRVGDAAGFSSALDNYMKEFPTAARTADFKRVEAEAAAWPLMEEWNHYDQEFAELARAGIVNNAAALTEITAGAVTKFGKSPHGPLLEQRAALLKSLKARKDESGQPIVAELQALFKDDLIAGLWRVELKDSGGYCYARDKPTAGEGTFSYIAGFDYTLANKPASFILASGKAPQSVVSEKVLPSLDRLAKSNECGEWEEILGGLAKEVLETKQLDEILAITLLKQTVDVGIRGSRHLAEGWRDAHNQLENSQVDFLAKWMAPGDSDANLTRPQARRELIGMANLPKLAQDAAAKAIEKDLSLLETTSYRWVGWLRRDERGAWTCSITRSLPENQTGDLNVIPQQPGDTLDLIIKVGVVQGGVVRLDSGTAAGLVEGRPVWVATRGGAKPVSPAGNP